MTYEEERDIRIYRAERALRYDLTGFALLKPLAEIDGVVNPGVVDSLGGLIRNLRREMEALRALGVDVSIKFD